MITITPMAEGKIRELMQEEKDTVGLRVYVKGGSSQLGLSFPICAGASQHATRCWLTPIHVVPGQLTVLDQM